jgi:Protein of unknown function (DUF3667)
MSVSLPPAVSAAGEAAAERGAAPAERRLPGAALPSSCENCGARVSGRYCASCGQRLEPAVHSLGHFAHHALEDLTHADSRLWRTLLALLSRPGHLTREFLQGRRVRYLPPLRLYLVLSLLFFVSAQLFQAPLEAYQIELGADSAHGVKAETIFDVWKQQRRGETREQFITRECSDASYDGPFRQRLGPLVPGLCRKVLETNPQSLTASFLHNIPRAMFVFLPLLAGLMMLMYWRPRHYYVEHLLLFVHNHALVFLVATLLLLLPRSSAIPGLRAAVFLYFAWYMYRSMRVVYGQGRALTLSKLALLSFFYLIFAALMLGITTVYTFFNL